MEMNLRVNHLQLILRRQNDKIAVSKTGEDNTSMGAKDLTEMGQASDKRYQHKEMVK